MERLTEQMKRAQGITEQLKAENALEWVQRMYNIRACARGIVEREIIYTLKNVTHIIVKLWRIGINSLSVIFYSL